MLSIKGKNVKTDKKGFKRVIKGSSATRGFSLFGTNFGIFRLFFVIKILFLGNYVIA